MHVNRLWLLLLSFVWFIAPGAYAENSATPLPADQAFVLSGNITPSQTLSLTWQIAQGYHLYRNHFHFINIAPSKQTLNPIRWPATTRLPIAALGNPEVYTGQLVLQFKLASTKKQIITVEYQGCSDSGFCYPPFQQKLTVNPLGYPTVKLTTPTPTDGSPSEGNSIFWIPDLTHTHAVLALLGFFALGLLLAFTPCVLPMLPILASIIIGQTKEQTRHRGRKAFRLSLTYVLAMAVTYATAGLILAWLGANIQSWLQQAWLLLAFGGLLIILALAQWELFHINLPSSWQHKLHQLHHRRQGGSYIEVAVMGILATLIVSPCVTPPLIATLAYISQVGHFVLGGAALFILALGMGTPLLIIGTFEGALLPKAGPWLEGTKVLLGLLLLIVAGLVLSRFLSSTWLIVWWSIVAFLLAWKLLTAPFLQRQKLQRFFALLIAAYGILLLSGIALQKPHLWGPFGSARSLAPVHFINVTSLHDLTEQQIQAKLLQQPILLDFYAKWCLSCQLLDKTTFVNPQVVSALANYRVLRVDMTKQTPAINAILQRYHVYAPPQILLFTADGQPLSEFPLVGEISATELLSALQQKPAKSCSGSALFTEISCN